MKRIQFAAPALVLFMATCAAPVTHPVPQMAEQIDVNTAILKFSSVPPIYIDWFAEIVKCSGIAPVDLPTYWIANVVTFETRKGALAFYTHDTHRVIFGLGWENVAYVVRHEDLHHLLRPFIAPGHVGETPEEIQARTHPIEFYGGLDGQGNYIKGKCEDLVRPPPPPPPTPVSSNPPPV